MFLVRLVYCSRFDVTVPFEAQRILDVAVKHNSQAKITGYFAFGKGAIAQALEGGAHVVNQLYARIAIDPRHKDVQLLSYGAIDERRFGAWSMGYAGYTQRNAPTFLRFCSEDVFNPHAMSPAGVLALLTALANEQTP